MNPVQREYFRQKLLGWQREILADSSQTISNLREDTGEPIGLNRLEARPVATLSLAAQERHERMEKSYNDD